MGYEKTLFHKKKTSENFPEERKERRKKSGPTEDKFILENFKTFCNAQKRGHLRLLTPIQTDKNGQLNSYNLKISKPKLFYYP